MAMTKVKNLQLWCKKMAEGYRDVEVKDMSSSWKSGLAFCAIIHRFRPDLIDYDSLSKENVFENNNLAFEVAEKKLSIPAFLEAEDMVAIRVPDKLSIVTYVSQYYNYFHNKPQLGGPGVNEFKKGGKKKDNVITADTKTLSPTHINTGKTVAQKDRQESMGDKCSICHEKVYLLERHIENAKLCHRSCYRKSELSPQSRLSKRQQYRTFDEEKDSSKFRKLDHDKSESKGKPSDSGPDFWQRRAQAKAKELSAQSQNQNGTSVTKMDDTPSWKKTEPKANLQGKTVNTSANDTVVASSKLTSDKKADFLNQNKQPDSSSRPNKLADKFKELNERYLNASQNDQSVTKSTDSKGTVTSDTRLVANETSEDKKSIAENEKKSPVAKPRQNIFRKEEKMDTSENRVATPPHPRPVPRFKVQIKPKTEQEKDSNKSEETKKETPRSKTPPTKNSELSLPSKEKDSGHPKTPPFNHKEVLKPKSPQQRPKSEFTIKSVSHNKDTDDSSSTSSTPPPLPASVPPKLPTSSPPHLKGTERKSPTASPRGPVKTVHNEKNIAGRLSPKGPNRHIINTSKGAKSSDFAPTKPPRISTNLNDTSKTRDVHPMETDTFTPSKAIVHDPLPQQKAFLMEPKRHNVENEKKNREVFGGLLKSLADVRNKHDTETEKGVTDKNHIASPISKKDANINVDKEKVEVKINTKTEDNVVKFSSKTPQRPKSSFVSGRSEMFLKDDKNESHTNLNKGSHDIKSPTDSKVELKTKVTEKTTVTTKIVTSVAGNDTPEWKRQLDKRKVEQRPKSADILSNRSESDIKPDWQKEAERRMVARKGVYTDPEKVKVDEILKKPDKIAASDTTANKMKPVTRPVSPYHKKAADAIDKYVPPADKGKNETSEQNKEKRRILPVPPQPRDSSPLRQHEEKKKITVGKKFVFEEVEVETIPKKPQRETGPPKSPGPPRPPQPVFVKPSKNHMSAYQIQKELDKIDSKLTELELKGRGLENAIRNAKEEEEDDLMIDWFKLVSDKNELVRQEADIIYLSRQQELEAEHKAVEQQLRELVDKPDLEKSTEDKNEEEYLMQRLLDLVNQRSSIVDSMDEDRIRYIEEDKDIAQMLKDKGFLKDHKDGKLKKDKKKSKLL